MDTVGVEYYPDNGDGKWAQAMFLVRGYHDILWTDNIEEVVCFIRESLVVIKKKTDLQRLLQREG